MVAKLDPEVAERVMLKAGLQPLEPYKGTSAKWKSKHLACGAVVFPRYEKVLKGQGGCKSCGYKKSSERRKINEKMAIAEMIEAGFKPLVAYKGAGVPWQSKCLFCSNESTPNLSKVRKGSGCKFCKGTAKIDPLTALNIMLKAGLEPLEPYKNNYSSWKSRCLKCQKIVSPSYSSIQQGQGSCVYCARNKIDENDAIKVMLSSKLKPLEPYERNGKPWKSQCINCKKIVSPTFSAIQQGQGGCVYCSGKKVDPEDAVKMMFAAKLQPLIPYKSHNTKWKCKCLKCGKTVFPRYDSIRTGQGGCIYCAEYGINMNTPSYLYLITNDRLNSHKIGIGNYKKNNDRLTKFNKKGWETFKVWNFETGGEAWKIESSVFSIIRKELKLPIYLSKEEMPVTEGHTETISADAIDLPALEKIVNKVIRKESRVKK
jgi:hypothetical protein